LNRLCTPARQTGFIAPATCGCPAKIKKNAGDDFALPFFGGPNTGNC
jgi:hypothetical protein